MLKLLHVAGDLGSKKTEILVNSLQSPHARINGVNAQLCNICEYL